MGARVYLSLGSAGFVSDNRHLKHRLDLPLDRVRVWGLGFKVSDLGV